MQWGDLDILVNNAGISLFHPITQTITVDGGVTRKMIYPE